jgi:hypothetical protein
MEAGCHGQPLIGTEQQAPEIPFGPTFQLKVSIDKLRRRSPCCAGAARGGRYEPQ